MASFDECKECAAGYYLTEEKLCVQQPDQAIENCQVYQSLT